MGARVMVYWGREKQWFPGLVTKYDPQMPGHLVVYDDGDRTWNELDDLAKCDWALLMQEDPAHGQTPAQSGRGGGEKRRGSGDPGGAAQRARTAAATPGGRGQ